MFCQAVLFLICIFATEIHFGAFRRSSVHMILHKMSAGG